MGEGVTRTVRIDVVVLWSEPLDDSGDGMAARSEESVGFC